MTISSYVPREIKNCSRYRVFEIAGLTHFFLGHLKRYIKTITNICVLPK